MQIGARIKQLRENRDWSQGELCRRAGGLKREYLSRVENGHTIPALGTLERIAAALQVSLPYLVDIPSEGEYEIEGENAGTPAQVAQPQETYQASPQDILQEIETATEELCREFKRRIRAILQKR